MGADPAAAVLLEFPARTKTGSCADWSRPEGTSTPPRNLEMEMQAKREESRETLSTNARSLSNKLEELELRLRDLHSGVAIISETWFQEQSLAVMTDIHGYTTFSRPRVGRPGGGVAVYVRDDIHSSVLDIPVPEELECTWVKVRPHRLPRNVSSLAVCAVYSPPDSPHSELLIDHLVNTVDSLQVKHPHIGIIIGGDFNRVDVSKLCMSHNLRQLVDRPTRDQATLDLIITNLNSYYSTPSISDPLATSDHNTVVVQAKSTPVSNKIIKRVCRPFRDSSIRLFGQWITTHDWSEVLSAPTTAEKSRVFYNTLQSKMDHFFPVKLTRLHMFDKPWITPEIKSLIYLRQKAFVNNDKMTYSHLRNNVQRKIHASKAKYYHTNVKSLKEEDIASWHRQIKSMANSNRSEPDIQIDGLDPSDTPSIANAINKSLATVINSLPPLDLSLLPAYLPARPPPTVNHWDVYMKLQKVKTRKAAGPDAIPGKLIKEFAYELSVPLADILNSSLQQGLVPDEWKNATVVPVPKCKPPSVNELRPISLTSLLSKVAENFICQWAMTDILPNIDAQQFDLVTVYITYIRPITEYCAPVWHPGLPSVLTPIARRLFSSPNSDSEDTPVMNVPGVGEKLGSTLQGAGYNTVGDLKEQIENQ
ncbi:uncharacterized protein LOC118424306 [Branchiostoma floridae]|uniref:Uncharacterized protein LOC118424306 n=1 Tax=Branchiostoma floridae TaxID=7739 RepID=A0A9J7N3W5_BRAFL|nr:uncharacterized protein LOC118424306 [Branchiostoma floridae]